MDRNHRHVRNRRITLGAAIAVVALVAAACGGTASESPAAGDGEVVADPVLARVFSLFDGTPASLAEFGGAPLVVNFWASWCPSCVAEMSAAFRPVQREVGEAVTFLGMNIQDERTAALELLEETGVEWISAEDPAGDLFFELGGIGMPFTVFIGSDGTILDTHNGPLSQGQLRGRISEVFGV